MTQAKSPEPKRFVLSTSPTALQSLQALVIGNLFGNSIVLAIILGGIARVLRLEWYFLMLLAVYLLRVMTSRLHYTGKGRIPAFCKSFVLRGALEYFNMELMCDPSVVLKPEASYVMAMHPHGIHGFGMTMFVYEGEENAFFRRFPFLRGKMSGAVASILFYIPIVREMFLYSGYIDASRGTLMKALGRGNSVHLLVGGEAESLLSAEGTDRAIAAGAGRRGFVRLALSANAQLVPVYAFHTTDTYSTASLLLSARLWLARRFQVCLPIFWGRWCTPLLRNVHLAVAVGDPIPFPKSHHAASATVGAGGGAGAAAASTPDDATVDAYHEAYLRALMALFTQHKAAAGYPPERKLEIWGRGVGLKASADRLFWREGEPWPGYAAHTSSGKKKSL